MKLLTWTVAAFVAHVPESPPPQSLVVEHQTSLPSVQSGNPLLSGVRHFLLIPPAQAATADPPSQKDIQLLREAMATFYGVDRDVEKASALLTEAIEAWKSQAPDERAALYRVRGDCYMALLDASKAEQDYTVAIELLQGPGGTLADPAELPSATLGRARAIRSQPASFTEERAQQAAKDYKVSFEQSSREDWDTENERIEDGASRNPYAAWEWGSSLRVAGSLKKASEVHALASQAFDDIGDRARSVISGIDTGIDLAATGETEAAKAQLQKYIKLTQQVEGRDVELLQRVITKECEGRIALASLLWDTKDRGGAETQLADACVRLEQLEVDAQARNKKLGELAMKPEHLRFSIDDIAGPFELSCSKFKQEKFLKETVQWPPSLQQKFFKFQNIGK